MIPATLFSSQVARIAFELVGLQVGCDLNDDRLSRASIFLGDRFQQDRQRLTRLQRRRPGVFGELMLSAT